MRIKMRQGATQAVMAVAIVGLLMYTVYLHTSYRSDIHHLKARSARGAGRHLSSVSSIPDGYIPISISQCNGMETKVVLCNLNLDKHHAQPYKYPMFRDLVAASSCTPGNTITRTVRQLQQAATPTLDPAGFVFHESRVGSTLIANILASDTKNLVFSESAPPPTIALHCKAPRQEKVEMLRVIMRAMSNSMHHARVFFKFQSVNSAAIPLYTEAFPETPWVFVYRNPVEVLASHFKASIPATKRACLRAKSTPTPMHKHFLRSSNPSDEEFCAAHLARLSQSALDALEQSSKGIAINYRDLPGVLHQRVFPVHFGYTPSARTKQRMDEVAGQYSKSRSRGQEFTDDSKSKQTQASEELKKHADVILQPLYDQLEAKYQMYLAQRNVMPNVPPSRQGVLGAMSDLKAPNPPPSLFNRLFNSGGGGGIQGAGQQPGVAGQSYYPPERMIKNYLPFPKLRPLPEFLKQWPPDEPDIPDIPGIAEGTLERFDYQNETQRKRAEYLRWHEVPFMLYNVPMINEASAKWQKDEYLIKRFGSQPRAVTKSTSNHFMYYNRRGVKKVSDYTPPTSMVHMPFKEWLDKAYKTETAALDQDHFYLQLNSVGPDTWIREDLPEWVPQHNFWLVEPEMNRGINCRFGARGIIAEAHYDGGRNFVTMLRGAKRYILLPPEECPNLYLYPRGHPEARHAKADWSDLDLNEFPKMKSARAAQVIVRAGEVLYIPSYWFHYIVSTGISAQCNTRSGNAIRGRKDIADCGFY